ncbi:hypothetical protein P4V04_06555 [Bacillus subtilis]|nr:hypothetical protein [Bacillus subtilis]
MAEYFRKPTEVDAFKYGYDEWPEWFHEMIQKREASYPYKVAGSDDPYGTDLKTSFGTLRVEYGDYIVRDDEGDVFPMKPYNFIKSHEIDAHPYQPSRSNSTVKIDIDVSEALTGLKTIQREAKASTRALAELREERARFLSDFDSADLTRELLRRGYSK